MKVHGIRLLLSYILWRCCLGSPSKLKVNITVPENTGKGYILTELAPLLAPTVHSRVRLVFKIISQKVVTDSENKETTTASKDWLRLDTRTGTLKLSRTLDRENLCGLANYCLIQAQIVALPQKHLRLIEVNVVIDDVNDNKPVFPVKSLVLNLTENWPITDTINLDRYQAEDFDVGNNSKLTYNISSNPFFRLKHFVDESNSSHLHLYLLKSLDYEDKTEISFIIQASDLGSPQQSDKLKVTVKVLDVNDNSPKFQKKVYEVTLKEGTVAGYKVIKVSARDTDHGLFGKVQYFLPMRNSKEVFDLLKVDTDSGVVSLLRPMERGPRGRMRVLLEARDSDPVFPKTGEAWLVINVEDVNDNAPTLSIDCIADFEDENVMLSEHSPQGTFIAHVSANDEDFGRNGKVEVNVSSKGCAEEDGIGTQNSNRYFKLTKEGYLKSLRTFDRETCGRYNIFFRACDFGEPRRCISKLINILILDENEYAPDFRKSLFVANISEDAYIGTVAAVLSAKDMDGLNGPSLIKNRSGGFVPSRNGDVTYSIIGGDKGVFSIGKKSGKIRSMSHLDREDKSVWKLRVLAQDGGLPPKHSFTDVIIKVTDVNDNRPRFVYPAVNNSVVYADPLKDEAVAVLKALDRDDGENGKISFSISRLIYENVSKSAEIQLSSQKFSEILIINPVTGELRLNFTNGNLTKFSGIHDVEIKAADSGEFPLSSSIVLRVIVGKHPRGSDNLLTRVNRNKFTSILDPLYVSIILGSLAVFLVILVAAALIKCAILNKRLQQCRKNEMEQKSGSDIMEEPNNRLPYDIFQPENSQIGTPPPDDTAEEESAPDQALLPFNNIAEKQPGPIHGHSDSDSGRGDSDLDATCQALDIKKDLMQTKKLGTQCGEECRKYGHGDSCWMPLNDSSFKPVAPRYQPLVSYRGDDLSFLRRHNTEQKMRYAPHSRKFDECHSFVPLQDVALTQRNEMCVLPVERRHSNPCILNARWHSSSPNSVPNRGCSSVNTSNLSYNITTSMLSRTQKFEGTPNRGNLETVFESECASSDCSGLEAATTCCGPNKILTSSFARVVPCSRVVPYGQSRVSFNSHNSLPPLVRPLPNSNSQDYNTQENEEFVEESKNMFL